MRVVAVVCGGPSEERGISLNSARSLLDHLQGEDVHVMAFYIDRGLNAFALSQGDLYSNTPSDFDYKLNPSKQFASLLAFAEYVKCNCDVAFPAIHGPFGEDGNLQRLLETQDVPFVGTASDNAEVAFDKAKAVHVMNENGFATVPSYAISKDETNAAHAIDEARERFGVWAESLARVAGERASTMKFVVKPANAGSSIGVSVVRGAEGVVDSAATFLASQQKGTKVVVEPFVEHATEFTVIVVNTRHEPVALLPTEVEFAVQESEIFSYRQKYLPTRQVSYHTPPRGLEPEEIRAIRRNAVELFHALKLRDFARIDGWLLSPKGAKRLGMNAQSGPLPVFFDVNIISGMEQNSFLFQQAASVGLSHRAVLSHVLDLALERQGKATAMKQAAASARHGERRKVYVLFGGATSERQVSLLSGTNIWMKLNTLDDVAAVPFLLLPYGQQEALEDMEVLRLPYASTLRHTVEEVMRECAMEEQEELHGGVSHRRAMRAEVMRELEDGGLSCSHELAETTGKRSSLKQLLEMTKREGAVLFIAIHGGVGEDGSIQRLCEDMGVAFTGPGSLASAICMDKLETGRRLAEVFRDDPSVRTCPKRPIAASRLAEVARGPSQYVRELWDELSHALGGRDICIKPLSDGCSTGVCRLSMPEDLYVYARAVADGSPSIPANAMTRKPHGAIELPECVPETFLCESFVETDAIRIQPKSERESGRGMAEHISWSGQTSRWIEVTVGVLGQASNPADITAMPPSVTVAESAAGILSLEEKFQGGTGINLTPVPEFIASREAVAAARENVAKAARALGIVGFARIDCFLHVDTGDVIVIEANTVPGMTASTVLFHQALQLDSPLSPAQFLRHVVAMAESRLSCSSEA